MEPQKTKITGKDILNNMKPRDIINGVKSSKLGKATLSIAVIAILGALGLGVTGNDIDIGKSIDQGEMVSTKDISNTDTATGLFSGLSGANCEQETYNCADFKTQDEAQQLFEQCGGKASDVHNLDRDKDGNACVGLPAGN